MIEFTIYNQLITEHIKYNCQFCPHCLENKEKLNYNVFYKKKISESIDLWKCRICNKTFRLPNKYYLAINENNKHLYSKAIEDSLPKKEITRIDKYV